MEESPRSRLFVGRAIPEEFVSDLKSFLSGDQKLQEEILTKIGEFEVLSYMYWSGPR